MHWFEGEISNAINISKSQKSLFVVFVRDIEEDEAIWNERSIGAIVKTNKCVCLKLKANSQLARHFSEIYPLIIFPTVYFIGNDGQPLEVKVGRASVEELKKCFIRAIELHEKNISSGNSVTRFSNISGDPLEYSLPNIEVQNSTVEETAKLIEDHFNETNVGKAAKNNEKRIFEKKLDKDMKKHFQDDKENRAMECELKKKKDGDLKASDQSKKGIELDSLRKHVRIQFKLPDGSNIVNTFSSSDQLFRAQSFILQRLSNSCSGITLTTLHPKTTFIDEDYQKTLMELNLAPSAVLIVLPKEPVLTSRNGNIFMYFFYKFLMLYQYLASLIFPSRIESTNTSNDTGNHSESSANMASQNYGGARPKVFGTPNQSLRQRREGNIHRLTANDEDDEHATWNGNSTQQM